MSEALPDGISEVALIGGIQLVGDSGNVAAASAVATLTPGTGKTAYLTAFTLSGAGATAASIVLVTVTGLLGGTKTFEVVVPAGATAAVPGFPFHCLYNYPLVASGVNVPIVITMPSLGAGNTNACVTAVGFQA